MTADTTLAAPKASPERPTLTILGAISFCHFLNDMIQSLILAIYPLLKQNFSLSFAQIGLITLTFQCSASIFQPLVGMYTDKRPVPFSLVFGMGSTLCGLLLLSMASSFPVVVLAAAMVGTGSSVFHPESSRVARLASGGRHGLAQSVFQVGGNAGSAVGPLLAAYFIVPHGQSSVAWFSLAALLAIGVLFRIGLWYGKTALPKSKSSRAVIDNGLSRRTVVVSILILLLLIFSKYFYMASISSYYTFYLIHTFGVSVKNAEFHLFIFLGAVAAGTVIGGPIGDKIGRKYVIWGSILGVLPFTLLLPYADLFWTGVLSAVIGVILASAFSAILVYAQDLLPGRVGMVAGLFFGFAFGMAGIGAAVLGKLADATSVTTVYHLCAYLPVIGLLAVFLPNIRHNARP